MKKIVIFLALITAIHHAVSQEQLPVFTNEALVQADTAPIPKNATYQLIVYGAIGCSYSRYLIENLKALDACQELEMIILLNDPKDAILKEYPELIKKYRVYSNAILKHELLKNKDITPQSFLFKEEELLFQVKGVKKNMFVKIDKQVKCHS